MLLVHFDCKTDVDDILTAAALFMLLSHSLYKDINYHAVAGSYSIQEGLYVPPNTLFELAFDKKLDRHSQENFKEGIKEVKHIVKKTLDKLGNIWIAEAGQFDFTY